VRPRTIVSVLESSSPAKDVALRSALSLAQRYESDLHVIHVRPSTRSRDTGAEGTRDDLAKRITPVAEASGAAAVNIVPVVVSGSAIPAVADYAGRVSADLVVVGKKARRGSGHWSTGSFAAALGKAVTSPTIAIPSGRAQPADSGPLFRNILVAIDFSEVSRRALADALALAQQSGARLRLLHVLDGFPDETVYSGSRAFRLMHEFHARVARVNRELRSLIPRHASNGSEIEVATASGEAHEAILAASGRRIDLIVLGLPRRAGLEEFVAGSTVRRVLRRAKSPVLLVPGPSTASLRPADEYDDRFATHPSLFAHSLL
jgi:nucleotide-binding universal stress UspA family protein